jgi:outer membrane protein assembly factor BamD
MVFFCLSAVPAQAFWLWTPETGKWVNPKYSVKETPVEQLVYAQTFFEARQFGEAMREFRKLLKAYPKAREAAQAQFMVASTWEQLGKYARAVDEYQLVVDRYPFSDLGPRVTERQFAIANMLMEGKAKDSQLAQSLLGTEHRVVEIFQKVIKNDPYGPNAPASQYKIGLYYQARGEYQEARDAFEKTTNDYPDSKWAESARYQIAVSDSKRSVGAQYDQKVTNIAVQGFEDFVKENPDSEMSAAARAEVSKLREKEAENNLVIAVFYEKQKKMAAARIYYQQVVDKYGDTVAGLKARASLDAILAGGNVK